MTDDLPKPSLGNDPLHVTKLKQEVKRASVQKDNVKDLNYHDYNKFVIDKTIQINTEIKKNLEAQSTKRLNDAAYEAAIQMRDMKSRGSGGSFLFQGLDKILGKK